MKIKEVIAKTDLTDRAIRLYIENGLVSPSITENYSGRKNIEFSDDDLVTLQNIATLRKADFSIAEIKSITESAEQCKAVLESFIKNKSEKIENDSKIVEALSPLLSTENPDISIICEKLNAVTDNKDIPEEDTKTPVWEKFEKKFFLTVGYAGIVCSFGIYIINAFLSFVVYDIKYPHLSGLGYLLWLFVLILLIPLLYLCFYKKYFKSKLRFIRTIVSLFLIVPFAFSIFECSVLTLLSLIDPLFSSQTDNPGNYLDVDKNFDEIADIFPEELPDYADKTKVEKWLPKRYPSSTKYFYRFGDAEGYFGDIFVQWSVPKKKSQWLSLERPAVDEYEAMIDKYKNMKALNGEEPVIKSKGPWELIYYADSSETDFRYGYNYIIFAYNTDKRIVRLIQSYNNIKPVANATTPYYLTLDWYS